MRASAERISVERAPPRLNWSSAAVTLAESGTKTDKSYSLKEKKGQPAITRKRDRKQRKAAVSAVSAYSIRIPSTGMAE